MRNQIKNRRNRIIGKTFWKMATVVGMTAGMLAGSALTAWAGEWKEIPDEGWKYEEDGNEVTGWVKTNDIWYYIDPETGLWVETPVLNENSVCYLLENAVNKAGWYKKEVTEMVYHIDSVSKDTITVSLSLEGQPFHTTGTLNTFEVKLKDRTAKSTSTKIVLDL